VVGDKDVAATSQSRTWMKAGSFDWFCIAED